MPASSILLNVERRTELLGRFGSALHLGLRRVATLVRALVLLATLLAALLLGLRGVGFRRLLGRIASGGRRDRAGLADVLAGRRRRQSRAGHEGEERQADHRVANHVNPPVSMVGRKCDA